MYTHLGLFLTILPFARSKTDIRREMEAGTSREWWKSSTLRRWCEMSEAETMRGVLTEAPAVMGTWMSNTIILAVNVDDRGTTWLGRHSTLPIFNDTGSTPVRVRFTLEPAPAQGRPSPSLSIAKSALDVSCVPSMDACAGISPLTVADSSPGTIRKRSPATIIPPHTRPDTEMPDVCPLKTFEMGKRKGALMSRVGGSRVSMEQL